MVKINMEAEIANIMKQTGLQISEIEQKIKDKQVELKGLIKNDAALVLVAKDLGVKIQTTPKETESKTNTIKINALKPGMENMPILGKITKIFPVSEFSKKDGSVGKVGSFILKDDTGGVRFTLWNDHTQAITQNRIKEGDYIFATQVNAKEGRNGVEVSLGYQGKIQINPEQFTLPVVSDGAEMPATKTIVECIVSNEFVSVQGVIPQKINRIFFYDACPSCHKKIEKCSCGENGTPVPTMIVNATFDDGTGTIRITFFGDTSPLLLGVKAKDINMLTDMDAFPLSDIMESVIGKEMQVTGRVKDTSYTKNGEEVTQKEIQVKSFAFIDSAAKAKELLQEDAPKSPVVEKDQDIGFKLRDQVYEAILGEDTGAGVSFNQIQEKLQISTQLLKKTLLALTQETAIGEIKPLIYQPL